MKQWKLLGATGLLLSGLLGIGLAQAEIPADHLLAPPTRVAQQLPSSSPSATPTPGGPRKKARNSDLKEFKHDYSELLKKPAELGFHPTEEEYDKIVDNIRDSFVEKVSDEQMMTGLKSEVKLFLGQAKVDGKNLTALDNVTLPKAFEKVEELYSKKVDPDLLGYVCMMGVLNSLKDPHSVLMTPDEMAKLNEQLQSGVFGGVGIYIELDHDQGDQLTIFEPIEGGPGARAGLESGDQILAIDGKSTKGIKIDLAQGQIRGPKGSTVRLTINRRGEHLEVPITRDEIRMISLSSKVLPGNIGYIRLRSFARDTKQELDAALKKLTDSNVKGIILDLRNNGGGFIDSAVGVVSEFVPSKSLVVYTIDRDQHRRLYPSGAGAKVAVPVVVMINEYSASASEITAGALRDHKVATLVGDHSFGKGSVQQLFSLDDKTSLASDKPPASMKITIARFYSPNGDVIDKKGIEPQVVVDMEPRFVGKGDHDVQLKKAVEILGGSGEVHNAPPLQ